MPFPVEIPCSGRTNLKSSQPRQLGTCDCVGDFSVTGMEGCPDQLKSPICNSTTLQQYSQWDWKFFRCMYVCSTKFSAVCLSAQPNSLLYVCLLNQILSLYVCLLCQILSLYVCLLNQILCCMSVCATKFSVLCLSAQPNSLLYICLLNKNVLKLWPKC